jgi:hypothetical protein
MNKREIQAVASRQDGQAREDALADTINTERLEDQAPA